MRINGTPQPDRHRKLGGKKITGLSGGALGGCGAKSSAAVAPYPVLDQATGDVLAWGIASTVIVGGLLLIAFALLARASNRRDRRHEGRHRKTTG